MFDYSTVEESRDFRAEFLFSDDDEDMLMVESPDYKLRARKASEIRFLPPPPKEGLYRHIGAVGCR
jgi:hypothetical protein